MHSFRYCSCAATTLPFVSRHILARITGMDELVGLRAKFRHIGSILAETYGFPTWRPELPPVDELVCTILSQSTSDVNRDKAFTQLKAKFPTWEAVRDAPVEQVIDSIRPAGLADTKGPRIQE